MIKSTIFIRYNSNNGLYSISELWESLIWLEKLLKTSSNLYNMNWDFDVKLKKASEWSIIFDILIWAHSDLIYLFNDNLKTYLDFLLSVNYNEYLIIINNINNDVLNWYKNLESFFADHPITYDISKYILNWILIYFIWWKIVKNIKILNINPINIQFNQYLTVNQINIIQNDIKKWKFQEFLSPIIEWEIDEINIWNYENDIMNTKVEISNSNFDNYLSEWQEILPQFENNSIHILPWKITSMQVNRWETMKYNTKIADKEYNLILLAKDWDHIDDYKQYFNQNIILRCRIIRESLYKKPKLVIEWIERFQWVLLNNNTI